LFTAAGTGTNLIYGLGKGSDTASSFVWAAVSIGVSIIFALSWPALIISLDRRQWARALLVLVALILTGTYSVAAALGSAAGGRAIAAIEEKDTADKRAKAQAAYDAAKNELAAIKPSRPVAELQAIVARNPEAGGRCAIVNGTGKLVCPPHPLAPELARAKRRAELEAKIELATGDLANTGPARVANSDAKALSRYLDAIGFTTSPERLNDLLVLLAVLIIECGGGLALAVGMALGDGTARSAVPGDFGKASRSAPSHTSPTTAPEALADGGEDGVVRTARSPHSPTRTRLLQMVADGKGGLRADQRSLGEALGVSATRIRQLVKVLVAAGTIRVRTSSTGSLITLVEGGRA
jgi:hypothetical protein